MRSQKVAPVRIGPAVRHHRVAAGLTQAQLAELAGIADETLSRIETGRVTGVSMALCGRLAEALGVAPAELLSKPNPTGRPTLRPGERALLAMASRLDDAELADLVRAIRLMTKVARSMTKRTAGRTARGKSDP